MATRAQLLEAIASRIADYRRGELPPRTAAHADRWVRQFDKDTQEDILAELKTFWPVFTFPGTDACGFWRR